MTITEFLLARIADDEAVAREAGSENWRGPEGPIHPDPQGDCWWDVDGPSGGWVAHVGEEEDATHVARHDPARVLAECDAKRKIVDLHHETRPSEAYMGGDFDPACTGFDDPAPAQTSECDTLRALATVYADHPDYDEAWRG